MELENALPDARVVVFECSLYELLVIVEAEDKVLLVDGFLLLLVLLFRRLFLLLAFSRFRLGTSEHVAV